MKCSSLAVCPHRPQYPPHRTRLHDTTRTKRLSQAYGHTWQEPISPAFNPHVLGSVSLTWPKQVLSLGQAQTVNGLSSFSKGLRYTIIFSSSLYLLYIRCCRGVQDTVLFLVLARNKTLKFDSHLRFDPLFTIPNS